MKHHRLHSQTRRESVRPAGQDVKVARILVRRIAVHGLSVSPAIDTLIRDVYQRLQKTQRSTDCESRLVDVAAYQILPFLESLLASRDTRATGGRTMRI